ncbi:hypothetical protein Zmor_025792 [Zophobas morio]|uniref:Uncharacterized protein n=1 Tax=Zophobas morio TaxID=2755281 RepID=A0AA38HSU0_9CUCU|nr:hypothetical protein Zmor_025792 [Zophobas morio]
MVNWYAVGLAAALVYIVPKRYFIQKVLNYYRFRSLNMPPKTIVVLLDDIGLNYEKARLYAKKSARIIIGGQNRIKIETARKELIRLTKNKNVISIQVNRFDKNSLKTFAQEVMDSEVAVDAIINNTGKELADLDIIFKTQDLARERFENHCLNFLYVGLPDDL